MHSILLYPLLIYLFNPLPISLSLLAFFRNLFLPSGLADLLVLACLIGSLSGGLVVFQEFLFLHLIVLLFLLELQPFDFGIGSYVQEQLFSLYDEVWCKQPYQDLSFLKFLKINIYRFWEEMA